MLADFEIDRHSAFSARFDGEGDIACAQVGNVAQEINSMISIKSAALAIAASMIGSTPGLADGPTEVARHMDREIGMCVAEVGKRANYDDARRVVHKIIDIEQKNLAEQRISIETLVYTTDNDAWTREYASRCVTRGALKVVSFDISETETAKYAASL